MTFYQTTTTLLPPCHQNAEWKSKLQQEMVGKKLTELRTPSFVVDKTAVERNSANLGRISTELNTKVSVHVKTHKSIRITEIQLEATKSDAIVVSTLAEAYFMVDSHLTKSHLLKEVLLAFPISPDKFNDVIEISKKVSAFQVFIDNLSALDAWESYCVQSANNEKLNVFLKVDCGLDRSGVSLDSPHAIELVKRLQDSTHVNFCGIYLFAGQSYAAKTPQEALEYLKYECNYARKFRDHCTPHGVKIDAISIGCTPTVMAITAFMDDDQVNMPQIVDGITEVHVGASVFLDRHKVHMGLCKYSDVAISVACRVASRHEDRNSILIDGGGLAFSKEVAPQGHFGDVLDPLNKDEEGEPKVIAILSKISQEHGVLQNLSASTLSRLELQIGQLVRVIPNQCSLVSACHLFYLVVENGGDTVVDVWVPVRGW